MCVTAYIDDSMAFPVQTTQFSTGAAFDAASPPTYRVYEGGTTTPILTGSTAKLDDANTTGLYIGVITISLANGFDVGKYYTVYAQATVDGVAGAKVVREFVVRSDEWGGSVAEFTGRATTLRGMIWQTWAYLFNRNTYAGDVQRVLLSDDSTVMTLGAVTNTDTETIKGKMQ